MEVEKWRRGLTLVEVLIVVSVIAMLVAIAVPNLMRAKHNANETAALSGLRTLSTALEAFRGAQSPQNYPTDLSQLSRSNPSYVPSSLTRRASRQGYLYLYVRTSPDAYDLQAVPEVVGTTGTRRFYVDETGVIRASATGPAGPTSPEVE